MEYVRFHVKFDNRVKQYLSIDKIIKSPVQYIAACVVAIGNGAQLLKL